MLHQTLPTFLSTQSFCFFSSSPSLASTLSSSTITSSSFHQVKTEMEIVETKALKKSFRPEMNMKLTQEPVSEDVWVDNVIPSDDFFVDDLLDFSKEEVLNEQDDEEEKDFLSVSSSHEETHNENENENDNENDNSNGVSVKEEFGSVPGSELSVPTDDVEQLEWLSHFVEDSFTEYSLLPYPEENPLGKILNPKQKPLSEPETLLKESETETSIIPFVAKGRSKRIKRRVQHFPHQLWSLGSSETSNSSSSGSTSSASSGSSSSCLIFNNTTPNHELLYLFDEQPTKKKLKRVSSSEISGAQIQRRCSHCGVQKTPQWRAGPLGAKTLCNACGVRFKSGRLYPEYRPALSPTFSSEVHSNSHRKVLEMRRKKESELAPPVQSF